ncbi:MAG: 3-isopropylmalate dehydrogenase [Clostridia bacterium]|nr:3-isopropylmalate dehydrogenase [Clostridia bacterium]
MEKNIAVLRGDGIGPEVVNEGVKVLNAVAARFGHRFSYLDIIGGVAGLEAYGDALRDQDYEAAKNCDSILFGSVGDPRKYTYTGANGTKKYPSRKESAVKALASFRRGMNLFANVRPAKVYPQLVAASPLKDKIAADMDLIVLRENTAGIFYAGKYHKELSGEMCAMDECAYTWTQVERHARCAFELAMGRKKKVTMVNKPNAMETGVLWENVYEKVAEEFPEVHYEAMLVDGCAARLVTRPGQFDIIAAENMFGGILSDLANSAAGSMGLAGSGDIGNESKGLYECAGGSAPDIAGMDMANPIAEILSAALMLRLSFHMDREAEAIENAVVKVFDEGFRTGDIMTSGGKKLSCGEMGSAIAERV